MRHVFQNYDNQVWKKKELIIVLNNDNMDKRRWEKRAKKSPNVSVFQLLGHITLGECLNFAIEKARYEVIAKFDDDDYYAPNYLVSSMAALKMSKADIVGKRTVYMYFEQNRTLAINDAGKENEFVTQGVKGATLIFKKALWEKIRFPKINLGEDTVFLRQCIKNNYKIYSADKTNYACFRRAKKGHHTWNIKNSILLEKSAFVCTTEDFTPYVLK